MPQPHPLVPHAQCPDTVSPFGIKSSQRPGDISRKQIHPFHGNRNQGAQKCILPEPSVSQPGAGEQGVKAATSASSVPCPTTRCSGSIRSGQTGKGASHRFFAGMGLCTDHPHPRAPWTPVGPVSGVWDSHGPLRSPCGLALEGKCSEALGPARHCSSQGRRL